MTDYEIISLAGQLNDSLESHFMNFVTIYFAVVVASYFVASKLPWLVLVAVLTMFTGFTVLNIAIVDGIILQNELIASTYGEKSTSLPSLWKGQGEASVLAYAGPIAFFAMYLLGYVSAMFFAIYMKIRGSQDDSS